MSEQEPHRNGHRRGVHFDPTINLGHVLTGTMFLITATAGYVTLNARVSALETGKIEARDTVVGVEARLLTRINEQRAHLDQTQVRTADDIREMKQIIRDGFRDLDAKLDRKQDKPGR